MRGTKIFAALCCTAMLLAACEKNDPKEANNHDTKNDTKEAVDLGLSVKWATCNLGATTPKEYGNYYAWGEVSPKSNYGEDNYTFSDRPDVLPAANDAASQNWGDNWRMPTIDEWQELIDKCTWTWTTNGAKGYEVKASNGNTIFLPAAGYYYGEELLNAGSRGSYWSSSLDTSYPACARSVNFDSNGRFVDGRRFCGISVRPVCK